MHTSPIKRGKVVCLHRVFVWVILIEFSEDAQKLQRASWPASLWFSFKLSQDLIDFQGDREFMTFPGFFSIPKNPSENRPIMSWFFGKKGMFFVCFN